MFRKIDYISVCVCACVCACVCVCVYVCMYLCLCALILCSIIFPSTSGRMWALSSERKNDEVDFIDWMLTSWRKSTLIHKTLSQTSNVFNYYRTAKNIKKI